MNAIAPVTDIPSLSAITPAVQRGNGPITQKQAFQEAVGGLFYAQMIKALRQGVGKPAYIHGGQAEEMFQEQMDQQVASNFARTHSAGFVEELYQRFLIDHPEGPAKQSSELSSLVQAAKSASAMESAQQAAWARPSTSGAGNTTRTGVIPALNRK